MSGNDFHEFGSNFNISICIKLGVSVNAIVVRKSNLSSELGPPICRLSIQRRGHLSPAATELPLECLTNSCADHCLSTFGSWVQQTLTQELHSASNWAKTFEISKLGHWWPLALVLSNHLAIILKGFAFAMFFFTTPTMSDQAKTHIHSTSFPCPLFGRRYFTPFPGSTWSHHNQSIVGARLFCISMQTVEVDCKVEGSQCQIVLSQCIFNLPA